MPGGRKKEKKRKQKYKRERERWRGEERRWLPVITVKSHRETERESVCVVG